MKRVMSSALVLSLLASGAAFAQNGPAMERRGVFRQERSDLQQAYGQGGGQQRQERGDAQRAERQDRGERQDWSQRQDRGERPNRERQAEAVQAPVQQQQQPQQRADRPERVQRPDAAQAQQQQSRGQWRSDRGVDQRDQNRGQWSGQGAAGRNDDRAQWNGQRNDDRNQWSGQRNDNRNQWNGQRNDGRNNQWSWQRPNNQQFRDRDRGRQQYDQRRFQPVYRFNQRYRLPTWRAPIGFYAYNWSYGDILPRGWYGTTYYLDWFRYGLPMPPVGAEWVRAGDDAILVDTWTGRVLSVAYDLFW